MVWRRIINKINTLFKNHQRDQNVYRDKRLKRNEITSIEGRINQKIILNSIRDIHYYKNTFLKQQENKEEK